MVIPPTPLQKPAVKPAPAPATAASAAAKKPSKAPNAPAAAGTGDIITGSVDAIQSTRMLSSEDSERLFSTEDSTGSGDLTTGAVGGQGSDLARGYCVSIGGSAADARIAWQKSKLADVEKEIAKRIAVLEAKTNEYKSWVDRRDQFLKRANETLVKIYTQMEPDAAALQLASMDEETSAALLIKLEPQNASAILNEMPPDKAARLTATISGAARVPKPKSASIPPPAEAPPYGEAPQRATPGEGRS
jgi:flagellar motility protein MotE (MotC chaperone)